MSEERAVAAAKRDGPSDELVAEIEALGIEPGSYDFRPLEPVRRTIARRMTQSFRDVPQFSLLAKMDVDALLRKRSELNAEPGGERISFNDLIIKASALALRAFPSANASYTSKGLIFHRHADIAVAVAIEGGLVTPIVRRAEEKSVAEISREMKDLAARARTKRLAPREYFGGTFTISNLGMFGITSFGSVVNPPQGGILSVGQPETQHRFRGREPYVATVLAATLTCDHRVIDGATGARWLECFKNFIEAPDDWAR